MRVCPRCGSKNLEDDRVCGVCGTNLTGSGAVRSKRRIPSQYIIGPYVALVGAVTFFLGQAVIGMGTLIIGLVLILVALSSGPDDPPFGWAKIPWLMMREKKEEEEAEKAAGET